MKHLQDIYIRLSDGLVLTPIRYMNAKGMTIINKLLYNNWNADEPPITLDELKLLEFVPLESVINKPVTTTNEQPLSEQELKSIRILLSDPHHYYKNTSTQGDNDGH